MSTLSACCAVALGLDSSPPALLGPASLGPASLGPWISLMIFASTVSLTASLMTWTGRC